MTHPDFLSKLRFRYQSCVSYEDRGLIRSISRHADAVEDVSETSFTTSFVRRGSFSFEWNDPSRGALRVWCENQVAYISSGKSGISEAGYLVSALKETAGISHGATMLVPMFLQSPYELKDLFKIDDMRVLEREPVHGRMCNALVGTYEEPSDTEIWISDDYLLRRLRRKISMTSQRQRALLASVKRLPSNIADSGPSGFELITEYNYVEITMSP